MITIVSTECNPEILEQLDGALSGRIMERTENNMVIFCGDDYNYRLRNLR
ncbi:hypothetical protein ACSW9O_10680 [Clostridium perfringens]|nr:hypothetical protein [Clostridium perfringens]